MRLENLSASWVYALLTRPIAFTFVFLSLSALARADGPEDNDPLNVRPIPPIGIEVDASQSEALISRCKNMRERISNLDVDDHWRAQVEVFPRAVEMTLETKMVYGPKDLRAAERLLDEAERRAAALAGGRTEDVLVNADSPRLLVGGFRSRIDGSVQPYGLEMPESKREEGSPLRLDVWLHGRGERSSEVGFLTQRLNKPGQYSPENTIVLHPYGRYSNAFKFAGEIDVIEAIEHVKQLFPIDDNRITIRGFSMGGAGCWQLAVHYPNIWAAANPGAGFSETIEFLKFFQLEEFKPTWYQQRLLHWYDCPDWTNNLRHVPTIAYSGEIDRQKQAADVMEAAFAAREMKLPHIIGPDTAHKIHEQSKTEIQSKLDDALANGRSSTPDTIDLTTYTLRYHRLGWLEIDGLDQHWKEARVQGHLNRSSAHGDLVTLQTTNVSRLRLDFPPGHFKAGRKVAVMIDAQPGTVRSSSDGSVDIRFARSTDGKWEKATSDPSRLVKRPGLQGPIDDAFMDAFTFVGPDTDRSKSIINDWIDDEFHHAMKEWRRHFRGDIVLADAASITGRDITDRNLVLFGTPETNTMIAKIASQLPIKWQDDAIQVGNRSFEGNCVPLLIYPNPLNPKRYVVINSGFTYREFAYLNNARQIPMLPDWAVVDVSNGSTTQAPGDIKAAGFFDEHWRLKPSQVE